MSKTVLTAAPGTPGRLPGVYAANGARLSPVEAVHAAQMASSVHEAVDDLGWLDPPGWWFRLKPLRWLVVVAELSCILHNPALFVYS